MWMHFHSDNLLEYFGFSATHEFLRSNTIKKENEIQNKRGMRFKICKLKKI